MMDADMLCPACEKDFIYEYEPYGDGGGDIDDIECPKCGAYLKAKVRIHCEAICEEIEVVHDAEGGD